MESARLSHHQLSGSEGKAAIHRKRYFVHLYSPRSNQRGQWHLHSPPGGLILVVRVRHFEPDFPGGVYRSVPFSVSFVKVPERTASSSVCRSRATEFTASQSCRINDLKGIISKVSYGFSGFSSSCREAFCFSSSSRALASATMGRL